MTEQEWLVSYDPESMLPVAMGRRSDCCGCLWRYNANGTLSVLTESSPCPRCDNEPWLDGWTPLSSDRKLRLAAVACVRHSWCYFQDNLSRKIIETAERFAEGGATKEETFTLASSCFTLARCLMPTWDPSEEINCVIGITMMHNPAYLPIYANILKDIVGNPWRPVTIQPHWLTPDVRALAQAAYDLRIGSVCPDCDSGKVRDATLSLALKRAFPGDSREQRGFIADHKPCNGTGRLETGHLDPDRLLILADALEEAGCDSEEILNHMRIPAPHVRGCWVLDLLLGKE